ncbi:class I adenylate-forming enzyme family protein [Brevibacillus laterosporus]|uniref:Long-chain fatty acid--CoA ligase n=1 Tax=Brevibacillus laterosporus TaxID=1465 RepID=A0AAP8QGJ2_BRELA|nr:class I adenylate-forming enzyme family protein [Brevibacillus laterosporus]PPB10638.1 long-chain fatty acid--CoA ligase [Brevibacillus laterosporus]
MIYKHLKQLIEHNPRLTAIIKETEEIPYQAVVSEADHLIQIFQKFGLHAETPLAIVLQKSEVIWAAIVAASHLNISVMLVDPLLKEEEMQKIMTMYKTQYVLREINSKSIDSLEYKEWYELSCFEHVFSIGNIGKYATCWNEYLKPTTNQSNLVFLTSGSTKIPSAVVKPMESLMSDGKRIGQTLGIVPEDRILCAAPTYHIYGTICGCFVPFLCGASVSFTGAYVLPSSLEKKIYKQACNILMAVPAHYKMLVEHVDKPLDQIRIALSATSPLSDELLLSCKKKLNLFIQNIYGSSEAGVVSIQRNRFSSRESTSVGTPIDGVQVKLDDTNPFEFDGKTVYELLIKSESLAKGYLRKGDSDESGYVVQDGWWRTGDLAYLSEEGELHIVGRLNITINVNGKKVNPYEIEEVLSQHPAIADAVVVGEHDPIRGEMAVAYVVAKNQITEVELLEYCREKLSDFKVPRRIEFREDLPKTAAGKVRRKEVR